MLVCLCVFALGGKGGGGVQRRKGGGMRIGRNERGLGRWRRRGGGLGDSN